MSLPDLSRREWLRAVIAAAGSTLVAQRLGADTGRFLRQPNVQNISESHATVIWTLPSPDPTSLVITDASGNSQTVAGSSKAFYPSQTGLPQTYYQFQASVSNLQPRATYTYQVQSGGQWLQTACSWPSQFTTAAPGPFSFLHFGDSGEGNDDQVNLSKQMAQEKVSLVLANGDLAYEMATCDSIEANYFAIYRDMMTQIPFFATLGNHEYYTDSGNPSLAGRVTPTDGIPQSDWGRYYSFDWGNAHFVALDSNRPLAAAATGKGGMLDWLDNDLSQTRKYWKVIFFHHPGYATGKHQNEVEAGQVRQYIVPILEKYGVQIVFNGHEHTYQRSFELLGGQIVDPNSGGIVYVTSGGGGAGAYYTPPSNLVAQSVGVNNYVRADVSAASLTLHTRGLGEAQDIDYLILAPPPKLMNVTNSASFTSEVASGGAISIFGRNFLHTNASASPSQPLLQASGCSVTLNDIPVPILYGDALQINAQLPFSFSGRGVLKVTTPNGVVQKGINVAPVAPAFFSNPNAPTLALAVHGGAGPLIDDQRPARAGETITFLVTGLGSVSGDAHAGVPAVFPFDVDADVQVKFANTTVAYSSARVSPSIAGVYEVTLQVPSGLRSGLVQVQMIAGGMSSQSSWIQIS